MARIEYPDLSQLSEDVQKLAARINPMLNVFRMLAHAESAYYGFMKFGNALLMRSEPDPILREIIILRVGHLSKSSYEIYQHEKIARHVGVSSDKIEALSSGENEDVFDNIENIDNLDNIDIVDIESDDNKTLLSRYSIASNDPTRLFS